MARLEGAVVVVTGAGRGIGRAIAEEMGQGGAKVVVNYASSKADGEKVVAEIKAAGGEAIAVQADVSKQQDVDRLIGAAKTTYGKIDVLVNNAGVYEFAPLDQITEKSFRRLFDLNVLGVLLTTQAAVKHMNGDGGSVINISSVVALTPPPGGSVYSATKGALDVITRSFALELGSRGIRVNSLSPGLTDTEGNRSAGNTEGDFLAMAIARTPLGRVGQPDDIAQAALYLCGPHSSWVTGTVLTVDGGISLT